MGWDHDVTSRVRVAVIGRTGMLLEAGRRIASDGHEIGLVATCRSSGHEEAQEADFARWANDIGAPLVSKGRLDSPEILSAIASAGCDMAISMNWLSLLPASVRDCFRHGIFNAHPGDLPRFKGNACPNWAILTGEPHAVLTIHRMDDALDSGPIASKSSYPLGDTTTIADVYRWLHMAVPDAFVALVRSVAEGGLDLRPQNSNPEAGLRCYPRRPEDGRIEWKAPATEISRLVRASGKPFGGAFTYLEGSRRLTVWSADIVVAQEPFLAVAGQVASSIAGDPLICCGADYLRLTDVTLEGEDDPVVAKKLVLSSLRNRLI